MKFIRHKFRHRTGWRANLRQRGYQVNDIYLRNLALGIDTLSITDLGTIKDIAVQCPFSGGRAVFKARAYLAMIGDSTQYDDETVCAEDENYRKANNKKDGIFHVTVNPNPSTDVCRFIYILPKDEVASIQIHDCYGKVIYHFSLPVNSTSYSINLSNFASGVFGYVVCSTSGLIGNGKLILIK